MKKSLKLLIFTLIVTVLLAFGGATALAADYEHCAEALQAMGLLQGSESGFELDRAATRAEAAVMLVRLMGVEQEAIDNAYSHPFTDVPEWAAPYVGYMYEKGLTKGVSADSFNPQGACDLRMYSAFILRVLGYTEANGDFAYAEAESFAMNLGVADIINASGDFQRDNMAAISYTALFAPTKGVEKTLLAQLIEQGIVQEEAAKPYLELYNSYTLLQANNVKLAGMGEEPLEMKLNMDMKMDMGKEGSANIVLDSLMQMETPAISPTATMDEILAALGKTKFTMANKLNLSGSSITDEGEMDVVFDLYVLDGVVYIDNNLAEAMKDDTVPAHLKLDINTLISMMNMSGMDMSALMQGPGNMLAGLMPADPYTSYYGISMIKSIKSEALADGGQKISMVYITMPNDMLTSIMGLVYGGMPEMMEAMSQMDMSCDISDCTYILDKDGNLVTVSMALSMTQTMMPGTQEAITVQTEVQMSFDITKTGADVEFLTPAQDVDYIDIMEMLMGGGTAEEEVL